MVLGSVDGPGYPRKVSRAAQRVSVLVTDLDNTLWDWFDIWHGGFSAFIEALAVESGVEPSILEQEIRPIHQAKRTSEYAPELLIPLLPSVARGLDRDTLLAKYDRAIHAFHKARKDAVKLYPGVMATLQRARDSGSLVLAYTESLEFVTTQRILRTGLDGVIDHLYSPPDHDLPPDVTLENLRRNGSGRTYDLKHTAWSKTPPGELKPNPGVLKSILADAGAEPSEVVYVGDSLMKDVAMAQAVGVADAWAAYGKAQSRPGYDLLQRVSHWSEEDVRAEERINANGVIQPTVTLSAGFDEVLKYFNFTGHKNP
jgi:phosphoglycolate phosphatase